MQIRGTVLWLVLALIPATDGRAQVRGENHGGPAGSTRSDTPEAETRRVEAIMDAYSRRWSPGESLLDPTPYLIHPQAGTLNRDLWPNGFVDLDPTAGILDFNCSELTYDTHRGIDTDIRTFTEQQIGVPVLAALDGTVVEVHDGEPDMNLACVEPPNYVLLNHGGSHYSWYLHLKNGSITVAVNDVVTAGTQIGSTASSGCSFWPHLHFESAINGVVFEPYAGPCRSGPSYWTHQEPLRQDTFLTDFTVTADDLNLWAGAPYDTGRTGHLVAGTVPRFWLFLKNLPASSTWRTRFLRPGGAVELDQIGDYGGNPYYRSSVWWQQWLINLDQVGTWTILYDVNGVNLIQAPFEVVASAAGIVNRPPNAITPSFDPETPRQDAVLFCRVGTSLTLDDPDYDVVRYRYEWRIDSVLVRDVSHAGQADALARDVLTTGEDVECRVTPSDGTADGPVAAISSGVGPPCTGDCVFSDDLETGTTALWSATVP